MTDGLSIKNLHVCVDGIKILKGLTLNAHSGSVHAIMGSNGSGKSSLAFTIMGHPRYHVEQASMWYKGQDVLLLAPDKRAKLGIFLAFQHPFALPGVTVLSFLKESYQAITGKPIEVGEFQQLLFRAMDLLLIDHAFALRSLNDGFSGGEKKRFEMLQLLVLKPSLIILDELDSGLDSDALKIVAQGLCQLRVEKPDIIVIIITHHQKILNYIVPDFVHILNDGSIVKTGSSQLALHVEQKGYDGYQV